MKKYLLPKESKFYKANLHMHTTLSDGKMTLEEVKSEYMKQGYSIVAFTDHEIMIPHNDLTDDNFLAITSTEIIVDEEIKCEGCFRKTYHLNLYSKEKNKNCFSTFTEKIKWFKHSDCFISEEQSKVDYQRKYNTSCVNDIIKKAKEENCLVSYNHPVWSLQDYSDYIDLKGLWGVEWLNGACVRSGFTDSMKPIDDLLRKGERVFPLATDDAHSIGDCFRGFVMVKSKDLSYENVYEALEKGDFYSSSKPEINELYIENGVIHIKTSKAKMIYLTSERRYTKCVHSEDELLTEAIIDINDYIKTSEKTIHGNCYIRITILDENNNKAHSRAYYLDELM